MRTPIVRSRNSAIRVLVFFVLVAILGVQSATLTGCAGGGGGGALAAIGQGLRGLGQRAIQNGPALAGAIMGTVAAAQTGNPAAIVGSVSNITGSLGLGLPTGVLQTVAGGLTAIPAAGQQPQVPQQPRTAPPGVVSQDSR